MLAPLKVKNLKIAFAEDSAKNQSAFFEVFRLFVFAFLSVYFVSFFKYKYTFGYRILTSNELLAEFSMQHWITQVAAWFLFASLFSFLITETIATAINLFSFKGEDNEQKKQ